MMVYTVDGHDYRLPGGLNDFQRHMYVHLINWKWQHLTREPGVDAKGNVYDAWLPPAFVADYRILYPPIVKTVQHHLAHYPFHVHPHFHHMASSQAATLNLFLPILSHPLAADVLRQVKRDFPAWLPTSWITGFAWSSRISRTLRPATHRSLLMPMRISLSPITMTPANYACG